MSHFTKILVAVAVASFGAAGIGCAAPEDEAPNGSINPDGTARTELCKATNQTEIASLFDRWNDSLQTGDADAVVANYAERSILLPTVSNTPRLTPSEKRAYFADEFLPKGPSGKIDERFIQIGCNSAVDAGLYTFTFAKTGEQVSARYSYTYSWDAAQSKWLITSHHSSAMPETVAVAQSFFAR
jgi:uncharacterized protein (TIGR02246 family)